MHSIYLKSKLRWKAICKSSCKVTITLQYCMKHTTKSMALLLLHIVINQQLKPRNNLFNCSPHQWIDACDWIYFNITLAVSTSTWLRVTSNMKSSSHKTRQTTLCSIFETSPNEKPKEKKVGGHGILYPHRLKKWGDTFPVSPT